MYKPIRFMASVALASSMVGACAAAAATSAPTAPPAAPPAAPASAVVDPGSSPTPVWSPLIVTPMPASPTPFRSVDPKAPAYVAGTSSISETAAGTRTSDGDCQRATGVVVQGTSTTTDPRASGSATFRISGAGCGDVGFEWGTMRVENAGGAWEGFCSGGIWNNENASDFSCWLAGSAGYEGLTYYFHSTSAGNASVDMGVILPMPAPKR